LGDYYRLTLKIRFTIPDKHASFRTTYCDTIHIIKHGTTMSDKYYSKITRKGQVTIPVNIRNSLHISVGSRVEFIEQDNCILIVPINGSVTDLQSSLPKPSKALSCEEMDIIIRGMNDCN
jgi:antitoxin PrlF